MYGLVLAAGGSLVLGAIGWLAIWYNTRPSYWEQEMRKQRAVLDMYRDRWPYGENSFEADDLSR